MLSPVKTMSDKDRENRLRYLRLKFMLSIGGGEKHNYESSYGKEISQYNIDLEKAINQRIEDAKADSEICSPDFFTMSRKSDQNSENEDGSDKSIKKQNKEQIAAIVTSKAISWIDILNEHKPQDMKTYHDLTPIEQKDYMWYLWRRLSIIVQYKSLYAKLEQE